MLPGYFSPGCNTVHSLPPLIACCCCCCCFIMLLLLHACSFQLRFFLQLILLVQHDINKSSNIVSQSMYMNKLNLVWMDQWCNNQFQPWSQNGGQYISIAFYQGNWSVTLTDCWILILYKCHGYECLIHKLTISLWARFCAWRALSCWNRKWSSPNCSIRVEPHWCIKHHCIL